MRRYTPPQFPTSRPINSPSHNHIPLNTPPAPRPLPYRRSREMPRPPDSAYVDLPQVFFRVQQDLSARLALAQLVEHASAAGTAAETHWIELFNRYLPA